MSPLTRHMTFVLGHRIYFLIFLKHVLPQYLAEKVLYSGFFVCLFFVFFFPSLAQLEGSNTNKEEVVPDTWCTLVF